MQASFSRKDGFTIVEVVITVVVLGLLTTLIFGPIVDFYQANTSSLERTTKETDIRGVLRQIENELTNNKNFSSSYTIAAPFGAKTGAGNWGADWSYEKMASSNAAHGLQRVLIATVPATDVNSSGVRYPVFIAPTGACPAEPTASMVANVALVYFMAPAPASNASQPPSQANPYNLYRRTIVPPLASGTQYCNGRTPDQVTTCAPGLAHSSCTSSPKDALLVSDIRSFDVQYYLTQGSTSPIAGQYTATPANPITDAKAIKITATTGQIVNGDPKTLEASIRISRTF